MHLPYDPIDLFPAIYPKETKLIYTTNKTNKSMTSAALFLKPKVWGFFNAHLQIVVYSNNGLVISNENGILDKNTH